MALAQSAAQAVRVLHLPYQAPLSLMLVVVAVEHLMLVRQERVVLAAVVRVQQQV